MITDIDGDDYAFMVRARSHEEASDEIEEIASEHDEYTAVVFVDSKLLGYVSEERDERSLNAAEREQIIRRLSNGENSRLLAREYRTRDRDVRAMGDAHGKANVEVAPAPSKRPQPAPPRSPDC